MAEQATPKRSRRTVQNLRSRRRTELSDLSIKFPEALRFDNGPKGDISRITEYGMTNFLAVQDNIYVCYRGLWYLLHPKVPASIRAVREIMIDSRRLALEQLPTSGMTIKSQSDYVHEMHDLPISGKHLNEIVNHMYTASHVKTIEPMNLNDRNRHCVVPFSDGSACDIRTGEKIHGDDLKELKLLGMKISVPSFGRLDEPVARGRGPIRQAAWDIMERQYGQEVIDRLCTYLCGTTKAVDIIRLPSNGGKTTLFDIMNRAFPGMFHKENATKIAKGDSSRFTPMNTALANHACVFVDEATHDAAKISAPMLNGWDAEMLETEEKHKPPQLLRRSGSVCFLASDEWPHVDANAQGFKSRFLWAADRQDVGEMQSLERMLLLQDDVIVEIRRYFLARAMWLMQQHNGDLVGLKEYQEESEDVRAAIEDLTKERTHPIVSIIQDNFEVTDDIKDFVSKAMIREVVEENSKGASKLRDNEFAKYTKIALGIDSSHEVQRTMPDGKRPRGYQRVRNR